MLEFPLEIFLKILSFTNQKEIIRLSLTSKSFHNLIIGIFNSEIFIHFIRKELCAISRSEIDFKIFYENNSVSHFSNPDNLLHLYKQIAYTTNHSKSFLTIANNLEPYLDHNKFLPEAALLYIQLISRINSKNSCKEFAKKVEKALLYANYFYAKHNTVCFRVISMSLHIKYLKEKLGYYSSYSELMETEPDQVFEIWQEIHDKTILFLTSMNINNELINTTTSNLTIDSFQKYITTLSHQFLGSSILTKMDTIDFISPNLLDFLQSYKKNNFRQENNELLRDTIRDVSKYFIPWIYNVYKDNFFAQVAKLKTAQNISKYDRGMNFSLGFLNDPLIKKQLLTPANGVTNLDELYNSFKDRFSEILDKAPFDALTNGKEQLHFTRYYKSQPNYPSLSNEPDKIGSLFFPRIEHNPVSYLIEIRDKILLSFIEGNENFDSIVDRINKMKALALHLNISAVFELFSGWMFGRNNSPEPTWQQIEEISTLLTKFNFFKRITTEYFNCLFLAWDISIVKLIGAYIEGLNLNEDKETYEYLDSIEGIIEVIFLYIDDDEETEKWLPTILKKIIDNHDLMTLNDDVIHQIVDDILDNPTQIPINSDQQILSTLLTNNFEIEPLEESVETFKFNNKRSKNDDGSCKKPKIEGNDEDMDDNDEDQDNFSSLRLFN